MAATVHLNPEFTVGPVDPRLYGGFVEHMGRCVYTGIYEPGHKTADTQGFRGDVMKSVRELGMPVNGYPGGNFVSQYDWEDGIGPKEERPTRLNVAWKAIEPNEVGTDEYIYWCRMAQTEPILAVNLGTRGAKEARALVEYCNFPTGVSQTCERVETRKYGEVESPVTAAVWDEDRGELNAFFSNLDPDRVLDVTVDVTAFGNVSITEALSLHDED